MMNYFVQINCRGDVKEINDFDATVIISVDREVTDAEIINFLVNSVDNTLPKNPSQYLITPFELMSKMSML